jgi:7-carboxy-7-deazaguanine synthase
LNPLDKETEILLHEGMMLPLMEEFYSLQGEGFHTGKPAYFARIGGCDVGCSWCDVKESWDSTRYPPVPIEQIIENAISFPAKAIVVTGGEPLLYNLNPLCSRLKLHGIQTFLETSGSSPLTGIWDWICLSPKRDAAPLIEILGKANELKVIIQEHDDFTWAEENAGKVNPGCILYLQPEWSAADHIMPEIVQYILDHPRWKMSLQSHKYMRIP